MSAPRSAWNRSPLGRGKLSNATAHCPTCKANRPVKAEMVGDADTRRASRVLTCSACRTRFPAPATPMSGRAAAALAALDAAPSTILSSSPDARRADVCTNPASMTSPSVRILGDSFGASLSPPTAAQAAAARLFDDIERRLDLEFAGEVSR